MRFKPFMLFCLSALAACARHEKALVPALPEPKLGMPLLVLGSGVEVLQLADILDTQEKPDSITVSQGFRFSWKPGMDSILLRTEPEAWAMGSLHFWFGGFAHTVPLRKRTGSMHRFRYADAERKHKSVSVCGSMNHDPLPLEWIDGLWTREVFLPDGFHFYGYCCDGAGPVKDPVNEHSLHISLNGGYSSMVSSAIQPDSVCQTKAYTGKQLKFTGPLAGRRVLAMWEEFVLPVDTGNYELRVEIPAQAAKQEKSSVRIWVYDREKVAGYAQVPLHKGKAITDASQVDKDDPMAGIMYSLLIDRFLNGDTANDEPVNTRQVHWKVDFQGGDIAGIIAKINDGYFKELGVNVLRLSPANQQIPGVFGQGEQSGTALAPYHGYRSALITRPELRFGNMSAWAELNRVAGNAGLKILIECVAGPPDTDPLFGNGNPWFEKHSVEALADSFWHWLDLTQADGLSLICRNARDAELVRALYRRNRGQGALIHVDYRMHPSPRQGRPELWAMSDDALQRILLAAFSTDGQMQELSLALQHYLRREAGAGTPVFCTGDVFGPRLFSLANARTSPDNSKTHAGSKNDLQYSGVEYFRNLQGMFALCCALPGIPEIYYGDEIGMLGGGPPDNHHMMRFDGLSSVELENREVFGKLALLRRSLPVLLYGDIRIRVVHDQVLIVERNYFGRKFFAVFNRTLSKQTIQVPAPMQNAFNGTLLNRTGNSTSFELEANHFEYIY